MNFQIKTFINSRILCGYTCFKKAHNFEKIDKAKTEDSKHTEH
jgi:hypothetical protein